MTKVVCVSLIIATSAVATDPPVTALAFAPDGKVVLVGSQDGIQVRTWPDLKSERTLPTQLAHVHDLVFSPNGKSLAAVGGSPSESGTAELFQWPEGTLLHRVQPHKDLIYAAAWSADSAALVTASADQTARRLDARTGKATTVYEGHSRSVLAVVFLPGDKQLVTAGVDESLRIWEAGTGKPERILSNHTRPVNGLAVRPTTDPSAPPLVVSISDDRTVRLWQPTLGRMVRFARLPSEPRAVAWTADGASILAAGKDGQLRVIDSETVEVRTTFPAVEGVAYSLAVGPDGSVLIGGQSGQLKRLQISTRGR
jgi:WD40 repeat protein